MRMEMNEFCQNMIQLEENARVLYLKFSEICDIRIRDTMLEFSEEEESHKGIILKIFDHIESNLELDDEIRTILKDQQLFYENGSENFILKKDKDFFVFSLSIERNSIDVYSEILHTFEMHSIEYNLFNDLIEQEKKHMVYILKALHDLN